jgi:transposase-like protein
MTEVNKKGGPYSKHGQEKRRNQVYRIYFEEGNTVVDTAKTLKANRKTVSEDVKYWRAQLADEMGHKNMVAGLLEQIHSHKLQKSQLRKELDKTKEFSQRHAIQKILLEIDNRLTQVFAKMIATKNESLNLEDESQYEISEDDIRKGVRTLLFEYDPDVSNPDIISTNAIKFRLIKETGCDDKYADQFVRRMIELGLGLCKQQVWFGRYAESDYSPTYNLAKFAHLRKYITIDELAKIVSERMEIKNIKAKLDEEPEPVAAKPNPQKTNLVN